MIKKWAQTTQTQTTRPLMRQPQMGQPQMVPSLLTKPQPRGYMQWILLCLSCLLMLGNLGCGFQLKGTATQLSTRFDSTYVNPIDTLKNNGLSRQLERLINVNGGKTVANIDDASIAVNITPVTTQSRQIALSSDASLKEYERIYTTTVTVTDLQSGVQLGQRQLSSTRHVQLDDRKVLAGEEQSKITQDSAERDLAYRIMHYLTAF
ncbi:LPS-assembly lipoprotein LptE [Ostreibacterium oceani]|uniref:LPS-assembly lipoprotein LptE n=1 Tax=Ostreibacterium oceani TaxID=2654998 RepID=A0A6N7F042_9GAMM|nr:hypothetical protein [Ostreibacterium oceani]MPV85206.1 hypothetical protein [Ostreibacterium oceani]